MGKPVTIDITDRFNKTLAEMRIDMESYKTEIKWIDLSLAIPHNLTRYVIWTRLDNISDTNLDLIPDKVSAELESDPMKFNYFNTLVKTWGPWDLKNNSYKDLSQYDKIIYNWEEYRYDDFWNIAYGYAGTAIGISIETLKVLAWYAQLDTKTSKPEWTFTESFFDDPRDQEMIQLWVDLYNLTNTCYEK